MTGGVKVVRFLDGAPSLAGELRERWDRALAADEPSGPYRVAVGEPLAAPGYPDFPAPPFAAVDVLWFAGEADAWRHEDWVGRAEPGLCPPGGRSCHVVAREEVPRGGDYLRTRWAAGGDRFKMMSFGRRNPALTPAQFSERWRAHAGSLGGAAIPAEVRGLAYVQNHPLPLDGRDGCDGREWPFDAVNEVYFERIDDLRRRREHFAARQDAAVRSDPDVLMSPTEVWSLFVREVVLGS